MSSRNRQGIKSYCRELRTPYGPTTCLENLGGGEFRIYHGNQFHIVSRDELIELNPDRAEYLKQLRDDPLTPVLSNVGTTMVPRVAHHAAETAVLSTYADRRYRRWRSEYDENQAYLRASQRKATREEQWMRERERKAFQANPERDRFGHRVTARTKDAFPIPTAPLDGGVQHRLAESIRASLQARADEEAEVPFWKRTDRQLVD